MSAMAGITRVDSCALTKVERSTLGNPASAAWARLAGVVVLAAAGWVVASCFPSACPDQDSCADANTRRVCRRQETAEMVDESCGSNLCVMTREGPICSTTESPVPECLDPVHELVYPANSVCWNGNPARCTSGYPEVTQACDGASCVDTVACGAVCVSGAPAPEHPACTKPGVARLCAAGRAVVCGCGHAPEETVCPETCVTAPPAGQPEEGFCALDSKEEDRCPKNGGSGDFCDGDVRITCHLKYVTARSACPACSTIYVGVVECATQ